MGLKTEHRFFHGDSREMGELDNESVDLVVTSPPYPMIEMWDDMWGDIHAEFTKGWIEENPGDAHDWMHLMLMGVWKELWKKVDDGGVVCINVGDATRNVDGFQMFDNRSKVVKLMTDIGFNQLPGIIWHKPSNSPNKFLGSGMKPPNAYATLEHEHILVFRKGGTRHPENRGESAYLWNERNKWFSDIWKVGADTQTRAESRDVSASFPVEIPYRLIRMFSTYGDTVLDPFGGTGTTSLVASSLGRNSVMYDIDVKLVDNARGRVVNRSEWTSEQLVIKSLLRVPEEHTGKTSERYGFPVKSEDSVNIRYYLADKVGVEDGVVEVDYRDLKKDEISGKKTLEQGELGQKSVDTFL